MNPFPQQFPTVDRGRTVVEFISEPAISITVARDTTSNEKPLALQDYTRPKTFPSAVVRRHRAGVVVQQ